MIDKRVIERQIRKGKLDAQAHQRALEALPDVSDRVARVADPEPARTAEKISSEPVAVTSTPEPDPEPSAEEPSAAEPGTPSPDASASY